MKVYNKRKFLLSALWIIVAISIIAISLVQGDLEFKGIFAVICCAILGINGLGRSISKKMSLEDKVEELDERNQLIELKSKRKAFQIIQYTLLITGFVFACLGGSYKSVLLGAVGVTSAGMWTLSLLLGNRQRSKRIDFHEIIVLERSGTFQHYFVQGGFQ